VVFTCFAVYDALLRGYDVEYLDIEKTTLHFSVDTFKKQSEKSKSKFLLFKIH